MLNMLTCLPCLPWFKPRTAARRGARTTWPEAWPEETPAADDERPLGCGWFDSSHELERGLQVRESDVQGLCLLPWSDWLELELRVWSGRPQQG